jgi:periplasmic copper chaperone A
VENVSLGRQLGGWKAGLGGLFVILAVSAGTSPGSALAHDYQVGAIRILHPWTRPTVPAQSTAAGYLTLRNTGVRPDRITGASSPLAERVEIHVTTIEGEVARMRQIQQVDVGAGREKKLAPRGTHLMLLGLKRALRAGERVPLTLQFASAGRVDIELSVDAGAAVDKHSHQGH